MRIWPIHLFFGALVLLELLFLYAHLSRQDASAIEARSGETTEIGSTEGESAVAKPDAQAQEQNP